MDWTNIALGAAMFGVATGVAGITIGVLAHRKIERLKGVDLRMEKARIVNRNTVALNDLMDVCEKALQSRIACLTNQGLAKSAAMSKWREQHQSYRGQIDDIAYRLEKYSKNYTEQTMERLESDISKLQFIEEQIKSVADKCRFVIAEDNALRVRMHRAGYGT